MDSKKKERVFSMLRSINRPGMDTVIERLESYGYFDAKCYGHHRYRGGVVDHSLEVYDYMMEHAGDRLPHESIVIAALFHDLGKAVRRGQRYGNTDHAGRSLAVLDECGLVLTDDERKAIGMHHQWKSLQAVACLMTCPLRALLSKGDCDSTGRWKAAHPRTDSRHHSVR